MDGGCEAPHDLIHLISDHIHNLFIIRYKMKLDLRRPFERMPYFTVEGFKQSAGLDNPAQGRVLLYRWAKTGHILPFNKGSGWSAEN